MTQARWMDRRRRFRELHRDGLFVMPYPWDIGSARLLASAIAGDELDAVLTAGSSHPPRRVE